MPNRYHRHIALSVKKRIWQMPCAVCGVTELVDVDHIIPVSVGGLNDEENLQPLCWQCNGKKSNRLSNEELFAWVQARGAEHYLRHDHKLATRCMNPFDVPTFSSWLRNRKAGATNA